MRELRRFRHPAAVLFEHAPAVHKRQFSNPIVLHASTLLQSHLASNREYTLKEARVNSVK
jgi:hypothetical protein